MENNAISAPVYMWSANVDGQNGINVADVTYLTNYLWKGGKDLNCSTISKSSSSVKGITKTNTQPKVL